MPEASIVKELQRDALDPAARVSDLLRKALLIARKLSVPTQTWIEKELHGYAPEDETPNYREIHGEVRARRIFGDWVPVHFPDARSSRIVSTNRSIVAISELESLVATSSSGDSVQMIFQPEAQEMIAEATGEQTRFALAFPIAALHRMLDAVRTAILEWALKLEAEGILGEGLTFTPSEVERASQVVHNVTNFYGPVHGAQVQHGASNPLQMVGADAAALIRTLAEVVADLSQKTPEFELSQEQLAELRSDLDAVKSQLISPRPKWGVVGELMRSLRAVLEGAGGVVAAEYALKLMPVIQALPK